VLRRRPGAPDRAARRRGAADRLDADPHRAGQRRRHRRGGRRAGQEGAPRRGRLRAAMADADLVLLRATLRPDAPGGADAIAVRGGRIAAIGRTTELRALAAARTIDLGGRALAPGFIDAHNHLLFASLFARHLDSRAALGAPLDALLARIATRAATPGEEGDDRDGWLRAWGFAPYRLRERRFPTRAELDAACPDRPLVVLHVSGHTAQVNSAGLRRLGIDRATPDPPGGRIDRDAGGEPCGVLHDTAMQAFSLRALARDLPSRPE